MHFFIEHFSLLRPHQPTPTRVSVILCSKRHVMDMMIPLLQQHQLHHMARIHLLSLIVVTAGKSKA
jgi:hypothetical protein